MLETREDPFCHSSLPCHSPQVATHRTGLNWEYGASQGLSTRAGCHKIPANHYTSLCWPLPGIVTERNSWVWLLSTQEAINRSGWWKVCFISEQGRVVDICPKAPSLPLSSRGGGESLYRQGCRGGGHVTGRNSIVIFTSHLHVGCQWSDQHHLDCFRSS